MDAITPPGLLQSTALTPPMTPAQQLAALPPPAPTPITHDITIVTTRKLARARAMGVPPEEFGIERAARDIKTCNYCYHEVVTKTEAQLVAGSRRTKSRWSPAIRCRKALSRRPTSIR